MSHHNLSTEFTPGRVAWLHLKALGLLVVWFAPGLMVAYHHPLHPYFLACVLSALFAALSLGSDALGLTVAQRLGMENRRIARNRRWLTFVWVTWAELDLYWRGPRAFQR